MASYIFFLLLGLGSGGVYALLATGLVLKYRSSGVVDFGHGAVAMFVAYVYLGLHSGGQLYLPWVVIPHTITVSGQPIGTGLSLIFGVLYSAVFGAVLYVLIYRPLRRASQLIRVCASVGTMLYLQAVAVFNFGTTSKTVPPILPSGEVSIFGVLVGVSYIWIAAIAIVVTVAVASVYRFSRFGLATRAASENEQGSAVIGLSASRIAGGNWVIASVLAGFAGIMIAPLSSIDPDSFTLFIVPVLGIALVARFRSFGIAAGAGFALAMITTELAKLPSIFPSLSVGWQEGLPPAIPFVVIILAMVFISRGVGARGESGTVRMPSLGYPQRPVTTTLAVFVAGVVGLLLFDNLLAGALMYSIGMVCIAFSVIVLTGYVGQVSLAQMSFAGVSACVLTHLTSGLGIGFPFTMLIASLAAIPLGLAVGLPALRVRGVNLAVITLATAYLIDDVLTNWTSFGGTEAGLAVPPPTLFGLNLGISYHGAYPRFIFGAVALLIVCLVGLMVARLRRAPTGRMMVAVRSNERAAAAAGIDVARTKLFAFGLSAWIAGLGGCLLAYQGQIVSPTSFSTFTSLGLLAVVMVAGIGRISGAIIAGIMLSANGLMVTFLNWKLGIGTYQLIVAGLALTITAIANPNGIAANPPPPLVWAGRWVSARIPGGWDTVGIGSRGASLALADGSAVGPPDAPIGTGQK